MTSKTLVEQSLAQVAEHVRACGLTAADIDQDAAGMREQIEALIGQEVSVEVAKGVAAGVWALQGHILSNTTFFPEGSAYEYQVAAATNMTLAFVDQILRGAQDNERVRGLQ